MAKLDMTIEAIESDVFELHFEIDCEQSVKAEIEQGIREVMAEFNIGPHCIFVEGINEYFKDTPLQGYYLCAKGVARKAFGISNEPVKKVQS